MQRASGAMAETLGDTHGRTMLHGPIWNCLNTVAQVILWVALVMLMLRTASWIWPDGPFGRVFTALLEGNHGLNYKGVVTIAPGGIIGVGFYFRFSGQVWCRFNRQRRRDAIIE